MNSIQLECFVKVADTLSFKRTSVELNLSQPTVSKQIESLEKELNVRLFNRSTRRVELTAVGERFLPDARNILSDMQHARSQVASFRDNASYSVRIGYTEVTELPYISDAFQKVRKEYPNVSPQLRLGSIQDHLIRLGQGGLDVVFGLLDIGYDKENITFHEVRKVKLVMIAAKGHPLYEREGISSDELKGFPQILYIPEHRRADYYGLRQDHGTKKIFVVSSVAETYALASAGMGYGLIPSCYRSMDPGMCAVTVDDSPEVGYGYFTHKGMVFPVLEKFGDIYEKEGWRR